TLYSAIPQSWFSSGTNCASTNFLFPPPEMVVAGLTAYNWAYNTFRRYYYPNDVWMEYTAHTIESGEQPVPHIEALKCVKRLRDGVPREHWSDERNIPGKCGTRTATLELKKKREAVSSEKQKA
ncbi:Uncharacterized protein APZ42_004709, partial [Daphnia magna]